MCVPCTTLLLFGVGQVPPPTPAPLPPLPPGQGLYLTLDYYYGSGSWLVVTRVAFKFELVAYCCALCNLHDCAATRNMYGIRTLQAQDRVVRGGEGRINDCHAFKWNLLCTCNCNVNYIINTKVVVCVCVLCCSNHFLKRLRTYFIQYTYMLISFWVCFECVVFLMFVFV